MLILCLLRLSLLCGSKLITDLLFSSANQASAVVVRQHFTTYGFHKCCITVSSDSHNSVASKTPLEADSENDDTLSSGSSELSDYGIWSPVQEAEVTVTNTELTFGKDSQDWFTALVLSFISIGRRCDSWDETHANLGCVPLPLRAHAASITDVWNHYFLAALVDALLSHIKFPLGSSVMDAQETASSARSYMCFAVQICESNGRECSRNIPGCHRTSGSRPSCVEVFVLHAGILQ